MESSGAGRLWKTRVPSVLTLVRRVNQLQGRTTGRATGERAAAGRIGAVTRIREGAHRCFRTRYPCRADQIPMSSGPDAHGIGPDAHANAVGIWSRSCSACGELRHQCSLVVVWLRRLPAGCSESHPRRGRCRLWLRRSRTGTVPRLNSLSQLVAGGRGEPARHLTYRHPNGVGARSERSARG